MKNFLAVYLGSASSPAMEKWQALDEGTRKEREKAAMSGWGKWAQKNAGAILGNGGPLGKTKLVNARGISDTKNLMTGYVLVQAESHEAAANLFIDHPHFILFPGDSVEIMECMPIPKI